MDRSRRANLDNPRTDSALQYGRTVRAPGSTRAWANAVMMKRELDNLPEDEQNYVATEVTKILAPSDKV